MVCLLEDLGTIAAVSGWDWRSGVASPTQEMGGAIVLGVQWKVTDLCEHFDRLYMLS